MTTLAELIGPNASNPGLVAGYADAIETFIMGGNDQPSCGDCSLVGCANGKLITTGQRMDVGEVENAYSRITGWSPLRPETNHGAVVEDVLRYWRDEGWPSDSEDKLLGYAAIDRDQIHQAIHSLGWALGWALLPMTEDHADYDFSDDAVRRNAEGVAAHCMAIIRSAPVGLQVATWSRRQTVSLAWWEKYGKGQFAVLAPGWKVR